MTTRMFITALLPNSYIFSWKYNNPLFVTDWPSYNQSLVRRGEILFSYDFLDGWDIYGASKNE